VLNAKIIKGKLKAYGRKDIEGESNLFRHIEQEIQR
jgi:hypothetical protein